MNQKNILNFFSYSIENSQVINSTYFSGDIFLSKGFITWEIIWGLVALKFVENLYLGICLGILLLNLGINCCEILLGIYIWGLT